MAARACVTGSTAVSRQPDIAKTASPADTSTPRDFNRGFS
jgi:hypothetical protein